MNTNGNSAMSETGAMAAGPTKDGVPTAAPPALEDLIDEELQRMAQRSAEGIQTLAKQLETEAGLTLEEVLDLARTLDEAIQQTITARLQRDRATPR